MSEANEPITTDTTTAAEAGASTTAGAATTGNATTPAEETATAPTRQAPLTEVIRYRKRAQAAEQQLEQAHKHLQQLQAELTQSRQSLDQLERRQQIDALLADADAVDVEAARLLTEAAVQLMQEPDVHLAVEDLRRHKPWLFRRRRTTAQAMPARASADVTPVTQAAEQAATTGDRRDLLRYLRLKRGK